MTATTESILTFPKGFLWGSATAAHQVEGNNTQNDWHVWEMQGRIKDGQRSGLACDHYRRFHGDIDLLAAMHHNAHRFSIEWSRIEPCPGEIVTAEIEHYRQVLTHLKQRGIKSFLTLHHFTSPLWFDWEAPGAAERFAGFAALLAHEYGPLVDFWIPINEPYVLAKHGYLKGDFPPGRHGMPHFFRALDAMIAGHNLARAAIQRELPEAQVGTAKDTGYFLAASDSPADELARILNQYMKNFYFLDRTTSDFIGINYYSPKQIRFCPSPESFFGEKVPLGLPTTDMGWEIMPEGLTRLLIEMGRRYRRPVFVTENGLADADDSRRLGFIRDHLKAVHRAIRCGADICGYLHWSLMDNFEWGYGYGPRFGLIAMDYATQTRTIRPSGQWYAEVCRENALRL